MIRIIFNLFKRQFLKLAFNEQSKPIGLDKMRFSFIDSNGMRHYRFIDDLDIPIIRKGQINRLLQELYSCLGADELDKFLDMMEKAVERKDDEGNLKPDISMIGFCIKEMKQRKEVLIHPDILMELMCAISIREDEAPEKWDEEIHRQKLEQLKKDSKDGSGLHDFFLKLGLKEYIPYLDISKEKWKEFMDQSQTKIKGLNLMAENYLSGAESLTDSIPKKSS